jgi:formylglycine-generating enzyme required for sulfatase activity
MPSDAAVAESTQQTNAKVFLSYSRKDIAFVDRLGIALRALDFEPLIDRSDIYAFEEWWQRIEELIARADAVVFVLSPDAVASDVALREVSFAASLNKRLAPVVYRRVDDKQIPEALAKLNFIFFDDDAQFEYSADQLADALNTDIAWVRQHTDFGEQARRWAQAKGASGLLLRSPVLEEAERWLASRPRHAPEPTPATRAFITESRRFAKQSRMRAGMSVVSIIFVAAIVATVWFERTYLQLRWEMWVGPKPLAATIERALKPREAFQECARCPVMVVVLAGYFMMGEEGRQHRVRITNTFAVSRFEVTFEEWDACVALGGCFVKPGDQGWGHGNQPVINVSWDDAKEYIAWISKQTGRSYRLLSEAEWEYAARAGSTTAYSWGESYGKGNANCAECGTQWDNKQTAPVGSFAANAFGLYDMHGNVEEWVEDCWHYDYRGAPTNGSAWTNGDCSRRITRGGSFNNLPGALRSANRLVHPTGHRFFNLGFRLATTLPPV